MSVPRSWRSVVLAGATVGILAACFTSPSPRRFGPANSPNGVFGGIHLVDGRRLEGELLMVGDTAYVLAVKSRVTIAPYAAIASSTFAQIGRVTTRAGEVPAKKRSQLVLLSRFPFGIPEPGMAALLARGGQQVPDTVGVPR